MRTWLIAPALSRPLTERLEHLSTVADDIDALRIDYMTWVCQMTDAELRRELQRFNGGEKAAIVRSEQQRRRGVLPRPPPPTRAVDIVHEAINASSGLGEP